MITPALITDAAQSTSENPFAQLALLPVHQVREHFTCSYVVIGSISVFVWDVLSHLRDDYHILTKHRFTLPTFVYILSRLSTLLYLIGYTIIQTTPLGHCNIAIRLATSLLTIALPATQLLLFLHVRAIYATERVIVWFFTLLWLSTFVSTVIAVVSISGINIGSTDYCTPATLARVNIATIVTPLVNDTLLFVALVVRIMGTSTQDADTCQLKDKFRTALFGTSIPRLAKTLLQNGQQYFLATVIINLASLILYAGNRNFSLGFPSVMLMNLMASRLYRKTKLTRYAQFNVSFEQSHGSSPSRPISFAQSSSTIEESSVVLGNGNDFASMADTEHIIKQLDNASPPTKLSNESRI